MSEDVITGCADLGVYLFRINLSHTPLDAVASTIEKIRGWTDVPICLDSEGAQLRNQEMTSETVAFKEGGEVRFHFEPVVGDAKNISFSPDGIARKFVVGDEISIDFDHVHLRVTDTDKDGAVAIVVYGGRVGSNKAADVQRDMEFNPLTSKDNEAIKIGLGLGIRHFALSFANTPEDVDKMRTLCGPDANIICKIESPSGLTNLDGIVDRADGSPSIHFDGDEVRNFFGEGLRFKPSDRQRVVATLVHLANKTSAVGVNVIVSALTASEDAKRLVLDTVKNLIIVYVKCSIETCAERDPKGLYAQAKNGEIDTLIGVNSDYFPPDNPNLVIDTEALSPAEAVDAIIRHLHQT